jgi:hypothetical protein
MPKLSSKQARDLSQQFLRFAQIVGDYRFSNWDELSKQENETLASCQWSLLNAGEDMLAVSTVLILNDAEFEIKQLNEITDNIKHAVHTLKQVQKVINIAAAGVSLGAAIISGSPQAIYEAFQNLAKATAGT